MLDTFKSVDERSIIEGEVVLNMRTPLIHTLSPLSPVLRSLRALIFSLSLLPAGVFAADGSGSVPQQKVVSAFRAASSENSQLAGQGEPGAKKASHKRKLMSEVKDLLQKTGSADESDGPSKYEGSSFGRRRDADDSGSREATSDRRHGRKGEDGGYGSGGSGDHGDRGDHGDQGGHEGGGDSGLVSGTVGGGEYQRRPGGPKIGAIYGDVMSNAGGGGAAGRAGSDQNSVQLNFGLGDPVDRRPGMAMSPVIAGGVAGGSASNSVAVNVIGARVGAISGGAGGGGTLSVVTASESAATAKSPAPATDVAVSAKPVSGVSGVAVGAPIVIRRGVIVSN